MSKYARRFHGDYQLFINFMEEEFLSTGFKASYEQRYETEMNDVKVCTMSFENKLKDHLMITIIAHGTEIEMVGMASDGSQDTFLRIKNDKQFIRQLEEYIKK